MNTSFKDKTVIITGGSMGVGAATARKFASLGANLVLASRGKKALEEIAAELKPLTKVVIYPMDVADPSACAGLLKKALYEFGAIHILINNAGYHKRGLVESVNAEELGKMIDVNLKAPIMLTRMALPHLREAGSGAVINVASLAGRVPVPGSATYSASKFGLRAFTFALADELRDSGIKLAAVSPGPIDTGFIMADIDATSDLTFSQPLSTADEVADAIVNLVLNDKRERSMPPVSGLLTYLNYLFPAFGRAMRPALLKRGQRVKRRIKAERKAAERAQQK
jgi:short-subunit dehydrogenase